MELDLPILHFTSFRAYRQPFVLIRSFMHYESSSQGRYEGTSSLHSRVSVEWRQKNISTHTVQVAHSHNELTWSMRYDVLCMLYTWHMWLLSDWRQLVQSSLKHFTRLGTRSIDEKRLPTVLFNILLRLGGKGPISGCDRVCLVTTVITYPTL